jgi:hypothetical protein
VRKSGAWRQQHAVHSDRRRALTGLEGLLEVMEFGDIGEHGDDEEALFRFRFTLFSEFVTSRCFLIHDTSLPRPVIISVHCGKRPCVARCQTDCPQRNRQLMHPDSAEQENPLGG